jgi:hypothetical protein
MYGLGPEKSLRLVYETFFLAIALLFTSSSTLIACLSRRFYNHRMMAYNYKAL